jgi:hypothetical protein
MTMADPRSDKVQKFREEQGATRVHILTAIQPFSVSQDRFVLIEFTREAQLVICRSGTPRTPFDHGQTQAVRSGELRTFLDRLDAANAAWVADAIPTGVSDGVTLTVEQATPAEYRRVRMVEPPENSIHARLLEAWMVTFPEIAIALT